MLYKLLSSGYNSSKAMIVMQKAAGQPKGVSDLSSSHTAVRKNTCKMKERQILFYRDEETIFHQLRQISIRQRFRVGINEVSRSSAQHVQQLLTLLMRAPWQLKGDLNICSHVFLREGVTHDALQPPYSGPHLVVGMDDKTYTVRIRGKDTRVSIDRIKPAYVLAEDIPPTTGTPVVNYRDSRNHHSQRRTTTDATSS
ncbi:hypothetical protein M514_25437 [Trichuris suis]|uniref:Uncharacterized protein n=1 Tax=Trichuris suis TaxID=68888 RepID=A0A085MYY3_9BILA|nr:hypothetical protein M514_25437 [Trichuris suis]